MGFGSSLEIVSRTGRLLILLSDVRRGEQSRRLKCHVV